MKERRRGSEGERERGREGTREGVNKGGREERRGSEVPYRICTLKAAI